MTEDYIFYPEWLSKCMPQRYLSTKKVGTLWRGVLDVHDLHTSLRIPTKSSSSIALPFLGFKKSPRAAQWYIQ